MKTRLVPCHTCHRKADYWTAYPHDVVIGGKKKTIRLCRVCTTARSTGKFLVTKFMRWVNPDVIECLVERSVDGLDPNKLTLKQMLRPIQFYGFSKTTGVIKKKTPKRIPLMTQKEKVKLNDRLGRQKFNQTIVRKKGVYVNKSDAWNGWDAFDYKDEDLSTLLG